MVSDTYQTMVKDTRLLGSWLRPAPAELSIAYQPLLRMTTDSQPAPALSVDTDRSFTDQTAPASQASVEARLEALRRWKDQGLISEEEYRAKKKQLLDRL